MTLSGDAETIPSASAVSGTLAGRFVSAPRLTDETRAEAAVAAWLGGLTAPERTALAARMRAAPLLATILQSLAENSPFLWELASREPERLLRLIDADPDRYFPQLLAETTRAVAATADLDAAM